jgi:UDP-N-acetylglucosamine 2-epimerase (non-hydrolysing)/GDP/UDP-N,N'-diacetylbacillosamine 2-epimerase (hydrolysing)
MANPKRKICFVTGTRADYGHLYWAMKEVLLDPDLEFQLIVTGSHLCAKWGHTVDVIKADGFPIDACVEMQLASDSGVATCKATALGIIGIAEAYDRLKPDVIVLLGDRYEELAAAQAALLMKIPVAHIHGGETSEGAMDESIRHAVTKLSHLHFVAAEAYKNRVLQLGENPQHVFNYGAPGLDHLGRMNFCTVEELEKFIGIPLKGETIFLVTLQPVTLDDSPFGKNSAIELLIQALDKFPTSKVIFTGVNADPGNLNIQEVITKYAAAHPERIRFYDSLGQLRYLSLMRISQVVIGNSSSGLIEAPALKVPTVNIGARQRGRLKARSVIDVDENTGGITLAIEKALSTQFRDILQEDISLYGATGNASIGIKDKLKNANLENILMKKFYDVN